MEVVEPLSGINVFKTAPYDAFVKITTYALGPIIGGLPIGIELLRARGWNLSLKELGTVLIVSGAVVVLYILAYVFSAVRKYVVNTERVVIKKPVGSISLPYSQIASVETVDRVNVSLKVWANAGLFGYFGLFLVADEKSTVRIYATNLTKPMVRIKTTGGRTIYLSPAEPEKFVEAARQHYIK